MGGGYARQTLAGTLPGCPAAGRPPGRCCPIPVRRPDVRPASGRAALRLRNATSPGGAGEGARPQVADAEASLSEQEVGSAAQAQGRKDLGDAPEVLNAENVAVGEQAGRNPETAEPVAGTTDEELDNGPKMAAEAIDQGLSLYENGDYKGALELFTKSLELPGMGAIRLAGKVKEYGCPSQGEENAALYNMACCYSQLGEKDSALECLKGLLENNYDDFGMLKTDPDLAACKGREFDDLVSKYDNPLSNMSRALKSKDSGTNKPWVSW